MNLKKIALGGGIALVAVVLALLVYNLFFATGSSSTGGTALDDGVLTVAINPSYDSYCYTDSSDNYVGFEIDLARNIAANLNVEVAYVELTSVATATAALNDGTVDLLLCRIGEDYTHSQSYLVSQPYGSSPLYLANGAGSYVNTLTMLSDATVYISENISSMALSSVDGIGDVSRLSLSETDDLESVLFDADTGSYTGYALLSEEEAVSLAYEDLNIQILPLLNSPSQSYVALANLGEATLMTYTNSIIALYLDTLAQS